MSGFLFRKLASFGFAQDKLWSFGIVSDFVLRTSDFDPKKAFFNIKLRCRTNLRSCHCEEAEGPVPWGRRGNLKPSEARELACRPHGTPRNDIHRLTLTEY
jgi:hypothetical protein